MLGDSSFGKASGVFQPQCRIHYWLVVCQVHSPVTSAPGCVAFLGRYGSWTSQWRVDKLAAEITWLYEEDSRGRAGRTEMRFVLGLACCQPPFRCAPLHSHRNELAV